MKRFLVFLFAVLSGWMFALDFPPMNSTMNEVRAVWGKEKYPYPGVLRYNNVAVDGYKSEVAFVFDNDKKLYSCELKTDPQYIRKLYEECLSKYGEPEQIIEYSWEFTDKETKMTYSFTLDDLHEVARAR